MKQSSSSQCRGRQSSGGQSSGGGGMSGGGMSGGGMSGGGPSFGGHYCRATCPSSTVAIQPPPFLLTIPGPSLYCSSNPCHIQSYGPSIGGSGGGGGGMGGGLGQIIGGGGGGGGGQGIGGICGGGRGGGRKYSNFFYDPCSELDWEPEPTYGSGLASLYYSRMGLPYSYPRF